MSVRPFSFFPFFPILSSSTSFPPRPVLALPPHPRRASIYRLPPPWLFLPVVAVNGGVFQVSRESIFHCVSSLPLGLLIVCYPPPTRPVIIFRFPPYPSFERSPPLLLPVKDRSGPSSCSCSSSVLVHSSLCSG